MRLSKSLWLLLTTLLLTVYYLYCAMYLNHLGYANNESLFYVEKAKIVFEGIGSRLKVMGLTAPIFPFYATFVFTAIDYNTAPILASAVGTALLFNVMANTLVKRLQDDFYLIALLLVFVLHPGILYLACSGKSMYLQMIFFFLFFLNIFKFYTSNTTFHVSIASICLVVLVFCEYKFIWLTLFFLPLVLSISIHSLNLSEKESIFRLFSSFNNPSLRRKLINKTFALYVIIFLLPLVSVLIYKMLNLTHAADLNYFIESPYATWSVLAEKINYNVLAENTTRHLLPEASMIISLRVLLFCPLMMMAIYLFRQRTYQILTLFTPLAFVEFLRIKYDKVYLTHQYYLMFVILSLLCVIFRADTVKEQKSFKVILGLFLAVQLYTGYMFMSNSYIDEERNFVSALTTRKLEMKQDENMDMASYINSLPGNPHILIDDAVAYPVTAYVSNIRTLILPYQDEFLSAIESPRHYAGYIVVATDKNPANGYTQLTNKYLQIIQNSDSGFTLEKKYETQNWILYAIN